MLSALKWESYWNIVKKGINKLYYIRLRLLFSIDLIQLRYLILQHWIYNKN